MRLGANTCVRFVDKIHILSAIGCCNTTRKILYYSILRIQTKGSFRVRLQIERAISKFHDGRVSSICISMTSVNLECVSSQPELGWGVSLRSLCIDVVKHSWILIY